MRAVAVLLLCVVTLLVACPQDVPPQPPPPPPPVSFADAAPAGTHPCEIACESMKQAECREGADPLCPSTLSKIEADRLVAPATCPVSMDGGTGRGCQFTCAWCAQARSSADVVSMCGSSCTPP